ncbi:MAG: hypothetical protein HYV06_02900 [Deltaproteobacteria bacterium]|nr:hypothetical protein [Deltaproteobacteria bacterium]
MLKYLLFIIFFAGMLAGYFYMDVPSGTSYDEMLIRVKTGLALVFIGGLGCLFCLHRISR